MSDLGIFETFGVPEFYITEVPIIEDAGNGNVRMVCGIRRNGKFQGVYNVVMPMESLIEVINKIRIATEDLWKEQQRREHAPLH